MPARTDLQTLVVSLEARLDKYNAAMARLTGQTDSRLGQVERRFIAAEARVARFGSALSRGLGAFGLGYGAVQALRAVGSAVDKIAELGELAGRVGVTTKALQALHDIGVKTGASIEEIDKGIQSIAEQSAQKGSFLEKLFQANNLKVSATDTEANLRHVMDLLQNARSESERLFIATQLFGDKVGRQLVEAFSQGGKALDEAFARMTSSGKALTDAQIKEAQDIRQEFRNTADDITKTWDQMALGMIHTLQRVGDAIAPLVLRFLDAMPPDIATPARRGIPLTPGQLQAIPKVSAGSGAYPYQDLIQQAASKYGLDPAILASLIQHESSFNPNAKNPKSSAAGLTQLLSGTAKDLGVTNPYDPQQSISGGAQYLKQLLDRFGNINSALAYYYQGPNSGAITAKGNAYATAIQLNASRFRPGVGTPPVPMLPGPNTGPFASPGATAAATGVTQLPPTAEEISKLADEIDLARDAVKGFFSDLISGLREGQSLTETLSKAFDNLASKAIDNVLSQFVDLLLGAHGSSSGGLLGGLLNFGTVPARAEGGSVMAGRPYLVGERGRELFVPSSSGMIVPRLAGAAAGGGGGFNPVRVEIVPSPYFDGRVANIAGRGDVRVLNTARKSYPSTAARFGKLGTTGS